MALIDEIKAEITQKRGSASETGEVPVKEKKVKKEKTKAEIEAYRQRKMAEEEARYLKAAKAAKTQTKPKSPKSSKTKAQEMAKELADRVTRRKRTKVEAAPATEPMPRKKKSAGLQLMEPLVPLCLVTVPGLPAGEYIAICKAKVSQ